MRSLILLPAVLLLAACATTPEQRAAAEQADIERVMAVYGPACARLGYARDSDQWRSCVLQLSEKDEIERYGSYPYYGGWGHWHGGWGPYW